MFKCKYAHIQYYSYYKYQINKWTKEICLLIDMEWT